MFFDTIITYSLQNKLVIGLLVLLLILWGGLALTRLPIDAVPDITNNQVQIITQSPSLAALEIEQLITSPLELNLANLPNIEEIRSVSRFGLSVITVVFADETDLLRCRQLVTEQIKKAEQELPANIGKPELGPISTGLGEIYQYVINVKPGYESSYNLTSLRSVQDWIVKRRLAGVPGVIEVSSFGGYIKEYEVAVNPSVLQAHNTTLAEVYNALAKNNSNSGGSYLEKAENVYFIRSEGMYKSLEDIGNTVVKVVNGNPILIRNIGVVHFGHANRSGAMTLNGKGEAVGGIVMMLKGANSAKVIRLVKERMEEIQHSLPKGLEIVPYLDRSKLVNSSISTVATNLMEGGLIVIFVLVILLGNLRAGLIVASVIPLSLLFAIGIMEFFGLSANLMSMGAIDFGLVVDGAVIIVESIYHHLVVRYAGVDQKLNQDQLDHVVKDAALGIRKSASFGEIIILMVYLPILALSGVEGKMFRPMAETVIFTIFGALILSLTWVPVASALFMPRKYSAKPNWSEQFIIKCQAWYLPFLKSCLKKSGILVTFVLCIFLFSLWQLGRLGGEFMPELDEGDYAIETRLPAGSSLQETIKATINAEKILLKSPEVAQVVGKIGTSEIPTDPMPIESADIMVVLKPRDQWPDPHKQKNELTEELSNAVAVLPGVGFDFQQPIQMRFNELMTGVRSDIAIKIYGDSIPVLFSKANQLAKLLEKIEGVNAVKVEAIGAVPQLQIIFQRERMAAYGLDVEMVNRLIESSFAGGYAGLVYEGDKRFAISIRLDSASKNNVEALERLPIPLAGGNIIPLSNVAHVLLKAAPMQISRDNTHRRIVVGLGVVGRDLESVVNEIKMKVAPKVSLPAGYYLTYGGQFQNYERAKERLMIAVPLALILIFVLLYLTFNSVKQSLLIFTAIPLSAIGGVWALTLRGMPFSISAGVGFIALFGVAVLNGIVLIGQFNQLKLKGHSTLRSILEGARERLRPVLLTAAVASLGFIPMALSTSGGAEVQRPLATVVIGGLISSTILTLLVLPALFLLSEKRVKPKYIATIVLLLCCFQTVVGQEVKNQVPSLNLQDAVKLAKQQNPDLLINQLEKEQADVAKKTAFDPVRTSIDYQYGRLQVSDQNDYSVIIGQSFALPGVYKAQSAVYEAQSQFLTSKTKLTSAQVNLQLANQYYHFLYWERRQALIRNQYKLLQTIAKASETKRRLGETIRLDYLSAKARVEELLQNINQIEGKKAEAKNEIAYLLKTEAARFTIDTANLGTRTFVPDSSKFNAHPELELAGGIYQASKAQTDLESKKRMPEIRFGYGNQSIEGIRFQQFGAIGLAVPLFSKAQKYRQEIAERNSKIADEKQQQTKARIAKDVAIQLTYYREYNKALAYYKTTGLAEAHELITVGNNGYLAGEIEYVQYAASQNQALDILLNQQDVWLNAQLNINLLEYLLQY